MTEETKVIALEAQCFKCKKVWNISLLSKNDLGAVCEDCGGYVVTPDGKVAKRFVYEGEETEAPLLDPNAKAQKRGVYNVDDIPAVTDYSEIDRMLQARKGRS